MLPIPLHLLVPIPIPLHLPLHLHLHLHLPLQFLLDYRQNFYLMILLLLADNYNQTMI